jgi:cation diffusion facilitator CzcD-associated flavoprotein CzcO
MDEPTARREIGPMRTAAPSEHVDVLILGAGLSGVGAACHLQANCPEKTYAILEAREAIGGTWDLFRYPGIRSDSDMFTLGYCFRPWMDPKALADGPSIRSYIHDTARENGVMEKIRLRHRAVRAEWSSAEARWSVEALNTGTGEIARFTCSFLYACTGYYRYDEGYSPHFPGSERFGGEFIHPQHWPQQLDCNGRRVVVIGSGATAVTLVPALADEGAQVTMLQRSPTYILSIPGIDPIANALRRRLSPMRAYAIVRWKNVLTSMLIFKLCRLAPRTMARFIRRLAGKQLPEDFDVAKHLTPRYNPWDQRLCLVPDGDLFKVISDGRASIATGEIRAFTESGIELASGEQLEADVIVSATGLNVLFLGGMELAVDGRPVDLGETIAYKGMMLCGVPNMAFTVGYTNASWTLKADLVAQYVCRLLKTMDARETPICTPQAPVGDDEKIPVIDLKSGYVLRAVDQLPKQGARAPWRLHQNYVKDVRLLRRGPVDDAMQFSRPASEERDEGAGAEELVAAA